MYSINFTVADAGAFVFAVQCVVYTVQCVVCSLLPATYENLAVETG